jgi:hypothetical protein
MSDTPEDEHTPEQRAKNKAIMDELIRQKDRLVAEHKAMNGISELPAYKPPGRDAQSFVSTGTVPEQVELQIALLTQGMMESMLLSSGEFSSDRGEAPAQEVNVWQRRASSKATLSRAQLARSADLKDAARLSEASAKLLIGLARLRGQFKQDFTVHHTSSRDDKTGERKHVTVARQNFTTPRVEPEDAKASADAAKGAIAAAQMALEALTEAKKASCASEVAA